MGSPINTLIEKPRALRWRSVAAMLRAFAERVDLNWGPHPGNIVAPESIRYVESLRMTSRD